MCRAPARPVCACFVRSCCRVVVQEHDLRDHVAMQRQANLFFRLHTALFSPRTSHFTLHALHPSRCILHVLHLTSSQLISSQLFLYLCGDLVYTQQTSTHSKLLHREAFTHRKLLRTASFYTEKLLHTASFYTASFYTQKAFYTQQAFTHSKLLRREAFFYTQKLQSEKRTFLKHFLISTRSTPHPPHTGDFTRKNTRFRAPASSPRQAPGNSHAAITMRFAATHGKHASLYAHGNKTWQESRTTLNECIVM